jgi:hypothetical protein
MPPGWTAQWDQNGQRWYYVEQATGRTQWDPPSNLPPGPYAPPAPGAPYNAAAGHDERGLFGNTHGHSGHDYNTAPGSAAVEEKKKDKDKGHSTAMLAAAGVGGIAAGALIGHAMGTHSVGKRCRLSRLTPSSRFRLRRRHQESGGGCSSSRCGCSSLCA